MYVTRCGIMRCRFWSDKKGWFQEVVCQSKMVEWINQRMGDIDFCFVLGSKFRRSQYVYFLLFVVSAVTLLNVMVSASRPKGSKKLTSAVSKAAKGEVPVNPVVTNLFEKWNITGSTITKDGWCLKEGMSHILDVDTSGRLLSLAQQTGLPGIYTLVEDASCRHDEGGVSANASRKPQDCFQSLCRIIAGQQLAGAAAKAVWMRLTSVADPLTPESISTLIGKGMEEHLRKPAGLSNSKARSIGALSDAFQSGDLSEEF